MVSGAPNDVALKRGAKRRAGVKATTRRRVADDAWAILRRVVTFTLRPLCGRFKATL